VPFDFPIPVRWSGVLCPCRVPITRAVSPDDLKGPLKIKINFHQIARKSSVNHDLLDFYERLGFRLTNTGEQRPSARRAGRHRKVS
jgi:hypothetical protein